MCGISGFIERNAATPREELEAQARRMSGALWHRGPDDAGEWADPEFGIAFGHRRLSIIDLSSLGRQPMVSRCGRYVVCYNGEVYNFQVLRRELEGLGHAFRGHSDTEVMLAAFTQWGFVGALGRLNGMFALALWDRQEACLHLTRDRMGEKPLYYGWGGNRFLFASELKAIRAYPGFQAEIDRNALTLFFRHNYIPAPNSIFRGIRKLPPATYATLRADAAPGTEPATFAYWDLRESAAAGCAAPLNLPAPELVDRFEGLLKDAVGLRMVSDVPLGAFLSGGIDSSTIVALMQAQSPRPVRTFTIGFHEARFNEAGYAKAVAAYLGTEHTELYLTAEQTREVIPHLPRLYDEPFSDSSQIPTYLVSHLARQHVTVSLSGDGGDELFGGYDRYAQGQRLWSVLGRIPRPMRLLAAGVLDGVPARAWHVLDRVVTSRQGFRPSSRFRARILARMLRWWLAHSGDPERLRAFDALGELGGVQGLSPFMRMQYLLYQSGVEFFQGRPRVALEMLEDGLREARHAGLISMFAMWFGAAATAAIAAGEIGRAQELLLEMAETHTSGRQIEAFMEFLRAKVEVAEGRVLVARDKLERSLAISLDSGATMPEAMVRLGLAFVHGEQGQTNEAYRQLRATFPALRRMGLVLCTATGLMIRAELAIRRGRSEWARVLLRRALSIAPRKGYLYLEWWSTAWLARLCAFALEHDIEPKHVRMLIRAYQLAPPRGDVVPEAWP